jgi:hypothetical protein
MEFNSGKYTKESEITTFEVHEHINFLRHFPDEKKVLVATSTGTIYIYSENLENSEKWAIPASGNLMRMSKVSDVLWMLSFQARVVFFNPIKK